MEGFDNIPYHMPHMDITPTAESPFVSFQDHCRLFFASQNISEIITYPFFKQKDFENLNIDEKNPLWPSVQLKNALNEEASFMQSSLVLGLLKATLQNRNRGNKSIKIFEIGRGFFDFKANENKIENMCSYKDYLRLESFRTSLDTKSESTKIIERNLLAGLIDSPMHEKFWLHDSKVPNFFDGKKVLSTFFSAFNIQNITWCPVDKSEVPFLHPKAGAQLYFNESYLGYIGELNPYVANNFELGNQIPIVFELDLEAVFSAVSKKVIVKNEISKFPPVSRDLAFIVNKTINFNSFHQAIFKNPKLKYLDSIDLFDQYEGQGVPEEHKSLAARYTFKSKVKNLTDKEIHKEIDSLVKWLEEKFDARLR